MLNLENYLYDCFSIAKHNKVDEITGINMFLSNVRSGTEEYFGADLNYEDIKNKEWLTSTIAKNIRHMHEVIEILIKNKEALTLTFKNNNRIEFNKILIYNSLYDYAT